MNKQILIAEDEPRMRRLIKDYLSKEDFSIVEASNGKEALDLFQNHKFDLLILDIMMPLLNGFDLCKAIREISNIPIIILTARADDDDEVMGYDLGADDYITKPFSPKILVAKVKALLRRLDDLNITNAFININSLSINKTSHEVTINGEILSLSPKEYDLLIFLAENKNSVFSRDTLLDKVWGYDFDGDIRTVDTHIKRLREKLREYSSLIITVRGSGYKLEYKD
ncbi:MULTISPECIES: response regulator transcription factor [Clostridium]|uniref:Stage 0 sporulation protein A homolog n=1 Tax=Clostridium cadaveris TaxID=1529 RepID=A0A1I2J7E2_9CLOT|nr:response regulator transcription factor [Clostridium cadaveris]MDU4951528.1 response regulator transcription factor [Clostridium sp.]MDM8311346.1 response regulator transcription factor [Clostridium cadaveris]MDY4950499.1 response regulator transcription factor [Clostridium cadaveris]NWK10207.1 response regulator transcription factor [Clostridium cadaveris]PWL52810.1 MAG: DNA-binding response regulator [Clostridium cadaveris]